MGPESQGGEGSLDGARGQKQRGLAREGGVLSEAWAGFLSDQVAPQGHTQACLQPVHLRDYCHPGHRRVYFLQGFQTGFSC